MRLPRLYLQALIGLVVMVGLLALIYFFYRFVEDQITGNLEADAANISNLYADSVRRDLQRHVIVPRILSRDNKVSNGLIKYNPYLDTDFQRIVEELDRATLYLVSRNGFVINASDPRRKNTQFLYPQYWTPALNLGNVNFFDPQRQVFVSMSRVEEELVNIPLGVIMMEVSFANYPIDWELSNINMMMIQDDGLVLTSRYPSDVGYNLRGLVGAPASASLDDFEFKSQVNYHDESSYLYITDLGINGWKLVYAVPAFQAQQQINGIVALAIFAVAFILLLFAYAFSRRSARQSTRLRRESEELRALNARLITEVEERRKAEADLESAEQSLEQSSKLAVIGQLSAAVGHELNQPLAAMRTYLATVRLLLRRSLYFEAAQNLNRIDDMVERMSGITRQMRDFARAHENEMVEFDLNTSVLNAFHLMAPQLGQMEVDVDRILPQEPVMVTGDQLRAEQILVNILRNALEAVETVEGPKVTIELQKGEQFAEVTVVDNGAGLSDPDQLFEPFYTTKTSGKGLGLGLAISASYAKDMGGNLLARNNISQGATFELKLRLAKTKLS